MTTVATDWIGEYERHLRADGPESTANTYMEILRRADRQLPAGLTVAHLDELKDWVGLDDRAASTRHLRRAALVAFFAFACDPLRERYLDFNPAALLPTVKVRDESPDPVPNDQLRQILLSAGEPFRGWVLLCSHLGLRCIELSRLDREHIRADLTWVQGKGGFNRRVPTHHLVWQYAQHLQAGPVAVNRHGQRLTARQVSRKGNYQLQKVMGYPDVHMHRLRHTYGTNAYDSCLDIVAVKELMGHRAVSTTQRYVAVSSARMRAAVAGLPDVA